MLSFTLLFASFGATALLYVKYRRPWLPAYLVYMGSYALFLLVQTYVFFMVTYMDSPPAILAGVAAAVRLAVSVALAASAPSITVVLVHGARGIMPARAIGAVASVALVATVIPYYFGAPVRVAEVANVAFNAYLGLMLAYALVRVPSESREPLVKNVRPFLVLSVVSYAGLVVYALLSIFSPRVNLTPRIPVVLNGALCFLWSLSSIVLFVPYLNTKDPGQAELPAGFAQRYRLTPREREVAELVLTGMRARDIAERLYVSTKTVEAHLYNVYRKCDVGSRVELLNRVRSWTQGGL